MSLNSSLPLKPNPAVLSFWSATVRTLLSIANGIFLPQKFPFPPSPSAQAEKAHTNTLLLFKGAWLSHFYLLIRIFVSLFSNLVDFQESAGALLKFVTSVFPF